MASIGAAVARWTTFVVFARFLQQDRTRRVGKACVETAASSNPWHWKACVHRPWPWIPEDGGRWTMCRVQVTSSWGGEEEEEERWLLVV